MQTVKSDEPFHYFAAIFEKNWESFCSLTNSYFSCITWLQNFVRICQ